MTFEKVLEKALDENWIVQLVPVRAAGAIRFYMRPFGSAEEPFDFEAHGNELTSLPFPAMSEHIVRVIPSGK